MTLAQITRAVQWYVRSVMGDTAYAKYCAHQRVHHPDEPLPTEREFWRQKHRDTELNPRSRCC